MRINVSRISKDLSNGAFLNKAVNNGIEMLAKNQFKNKQKVKSKQKNFLFALKISKIYISLQKIDYKEINVTASITFNCDCGC